MSVKKYKAAQASTENPRQTEYRLFAEVTKALMAVSEVSVVSKGVRPQEFYKAVDWNRRLWLALQVDIASTENRFPDSLKAAIASISIWVDKHSRLVLRGELTLEPLISVNRTIMEGLSAEPNQHSTPSTDTSAASAVGSLGTSA
jgi:flagellar protein FlaF